MEYSHNVPFQSYKKYNQSFPYPAPPLPAAQKTDGEIFCNRIFRILPFLPLPSGPLSDFPAVSGDPDGLRQYRKEACSIFPLFFFLFLLCRHPIVSDHQNGTLLPSLPIEMEIPDLSVSGRSFLRNPRRFQAYGKLFSGFFFHFHLSPEPGSFLWK